VTFIKEKKKFNKTFYKGKKLYYNLQKISGENASYLFQQFFQLHKSYENATGTRKVQLWHYKGKRKKMANRI